MGDVFKKLSCNAEKVVVDKKSDDTLEIIVVDSAGDTHNINVAIKTEATQNIDILGDKLEQYTDCLLYTSPSPRDRSLSRMPSSA